MIKVAFLLTLLIGYFETTFGRVCNITTNLRDKWLIMNDDLDTIRISRTKIIARLSGVKKLRYKCLESSANTFLLRLAKYPGTTQGVLCLGFAYIAGHRDVEYSIIRLNPNGPQRTLLTPEYRTKDLRLTLNNSCYLTGDSRTKFSVMKRLNRRCTFPGELRRPWNYTYHNARLVSINKKSFRLLLFTGGAHRFDCDTKDGNIYILRSKRFTERADAILCLNITKLRYDPFYSYEVSRLNSGNHLDDQVKLVPFREPVSKYKYCDWFDSPARPDYLY